MTGIRDWLDVLLATIGTGVVVGAAVALLAGLFGDPPTVVVGVVAGVGSGVATLFVAGAVVSLQQAVGHARRACGRRREQAGRGGAAACVRQRHAIVNGFDNAVAIEFGGTYFFGGGLSLPPFCGRSSFQSSGRSSSPRDCQ